MALLICGHARSGTTLLRDICNKHPDIAISHELGSFLFTGQPFLYQALRLLFETLGAGTRPIAPDMRNDRPSSKLRNLSFLARYLWELVPYWRIPIQVEHVETALKKLYPDKRLVGDKHPEYAFMLDHLVPQPGVQCVVIYRDPRDVTSSCLEKARTIWRDTWPAEMREAKQVAQRWVWVADSMQRHASTIFTLRYEDLVAQPELVYQSLGDWLGVDPRGFPKNPTKWIRQNRIGNYHQGLTELEIQDVVSVAGPRMEQLGYAI